LCSPNSEDSRDFRPCSTETLCTWVSWRVSWRGRRNLRQTTATIDANNRAMTTPPAIEAAIIPTLGPEEVLLDTRLRRGAIVQKDVKGDYGREKMKWALISGMGSGTRTRAQQDPKRIHFFAVQHIYETTPDCADLEVARAWLCLLPNSPRVTCEHSTCGRANGRRHSSASQYSGEKTLDSSLQAPKGILPALNMVTGLATTKLI
jgi:hypothetical protein